MFISNNQSFGLNTTMAKHFDLSGNIQKPATSNEPVSSFASALIGAFDKVNELELSSENLQQKMVTDPNSVNLHDVTIAQTEAELALSFTKSISTRVITAFNELTNLR